MFDEIFEQAFKELQRFREQGVFPREEDFEEALKVLREEYYERRRQLQQQGQVTAAFACIRTCNL